MAPALRAEDVAKRYGRVEALGGVSLEVERGELVGLLGPNGAGKSTLVKIACGLIRPSRGPAGRRTVRALLEELRTREIGVLLNSHLLSEVELVCDRVVILSRGHVVAAGRPEDLSRPRGVEIETDEGVRLFPEAGRDEVPGLVAAAVGEGRRIYGVRVLATSLEEEYLEAVGGDTG